MRMVGRSRLILILLGLSALSVVVWVWYFKPRHDFERFLAGDDRVEIRSIRISGQRRSCFFDDPEAMRYLSQSIRSSIPNKYRVGTVYYDVTIALSSGGSVHCDITIPDDKKHITIGFPHDAMDFDLRNKHLVPLPEPVPESVTQIISKLID
jgi:hypothetical protein